jgi:uncharacterized iron-regulated membrane protein
MSSTATPSDRLKARRGWFAPRWLIVTHRYLGVAVGWLMLLWCLSGVVMLFVQYPSLDEGARVAQLPRIGWTGCCRTAPALAPDARVQGASLEMLLHRPVLRARLADGERRAVDLLTGQAVPAPLSAATAAAVASQFGVAPALRVDPVARDQWTVAGEMNAGRPFWRVRLADGRATDVYVSRDTGQVVQRTTSASRLLNWFGAVPHWLYPTLLRQHPKAWAQVVIWTSVAGVFLTLGGLYLGLAAFRRSAGGRLTGYRGLMAWHHLGSLAVGLLTLTWVASGLLSMTPWGLLASRSDPAAALAEPPVSAAALDHALTALARTAPAAAQVRLAPLDGRLYLVAGARRYDAEGRPAPLSQADLARAGRRLGPLAGQGLIAREDAYYFSHHEKAALPAWRVVRRDGARIYLDPATGEVLARFDRPAERFRWLHEGLHRLDFVPGAGAGPPWALAVTLLLAAVTLGVGAGVWLSWRRVLHDIRAVRRRLAPSGPGRRGVRNRATPPRA